ncbi:MAG: efflux RND transporter permease subunit [Halieaceae bacterium]|jgi:multidrug efflux pump subunit AcrB|nr:efflux RND transporter permease subunit [Halieaceae bacterium]
MLEGLIRTSLRGQLPAALLLLSLLAGYLALQLTPREEEPQIVVPMVDVLVQAPGLSSQQVERQVTNPLEKLLAQLPGIEHIYSVSNTGKAAVTLRFKVGQDREESLLNTYNKMHSSRDQVPPVVSDWMIKPVEVDDVPILLLALSSDAGQRYGDYELRRMADEISTLFQAIPNTSQVKVVGGRTRAVQVLWHPEALAARKTTAADIVAALSMSNALLEAGEWAFNDQAIVLESGDVLRTAEELPQLVINVVDGNPVYLQDVADIVDGPIEAQHYTWIKTGNLSPKAGQSMSGAPMVALSIAKQRGSNAVAVASRVHAEIERLERDILPPEVHIEVLRDYGETANDKVNNLSSSLLFAVFTVVVFIGIFMGWRPALVVGIAVPFCYGITLALDLAFGYTINRVTLFALILSLGLLVDDPITGVDNIDRFLRDKSSSPGSRTDRLVAAIMEIRTPLLMSTITIMLAFVPLAYITGMMGPYMAPMAFNVPVSVLASTAAAFVITPWLASHLLRSDTPGEKPDPNNQGSPQHSVYARWLQPIVQDRKKARNVLWFVLLLFVAAASLPLLRLVPLKLLPYDNKSEIQVVLDMPEGSSLERTNTVAQAIAARAQTLVEVEAVAGFVGIPSPIDFNGMVRRYYQRHGSHLADLRITLLDKTLRQHQSHAVVLRLRELLADLNKDGISIKVVEVPPGPPVMSTLVAEVYADVLTPYETQYEAARSLMRRLQMEAHVVEVDSTEEMPQQRLRFVVDKTKAALSGVSTQDIGNALEMANSGHIAGYLQVEREAAPLPIQLRLPPQERTHHGDFSAIQVRGRSGIVLETSATGMETAAQPLVALGELGAFQRMTADKAIHHKDLRPVVYVMAELAGRTPAEVIADIHTDQNSGSSATTDWRGRSFLSPGGGGSWQIPPDTEVIWTGEGEWRITVRVFRDMGIAFAFALVGIFFVLFLQTKSTALSLIIMSAIPLTVVGIMPGFWLLNQFGERVVAGAPDPVLFTATAMIGMIALAGIVVRNSLILVEYISQSIATGASIQDALLQAGAVRMRPVLLTAGTTMLGNLIITLDPVFSGLAIAIIFGIIASTLFTLVVVPIVYLLVFERPAASTRKYT